MLFGHGAVGSRKSDIMALRERIARMEVSRRIDLERLHEEFVLSARDYAKLSALVAELESEFAEFQKEVVPQIEALEGMLVCVIGGGRIDD